MAIDTFIVYVGVYPRVEYAQADYQTVKELDTEFSPAWPALRDQGRATYRKLGVQTRREAVLRAKRPGILSVTFTGHP